MPDNPKVLFTSIGLGDNGVRDSYTYNFVTKEMEALVERGVDVYFFHEKYTSMERINGVKCIGGKWYSNVGKLRVIWTLIQFIRLFLKPLSIDLRRTFWAVKINIAISDLANDVGIDIIHTHFMYPIGLNCSVTTKISSIPVVSTLRGAELHDRDDLDYGACRDPLYRNFLRMGLKSADYMTAPNPELVRKLIGELNVSGDQVGLVPNGFELLDYQDIEHDFFESDALNILSVGNLIKLKNHGLLVEAVNTIVSKYQLKLRVVIVGKGPLLRDLEAMIGDAPIKIVPEMKKFALASYMRRADALVHASLLEGMPNVILEALSFGTPCIVSDISPHRMLIKDSVNGYIFDPTKVESLVLGIVKFSKKRGEIESMSNDCIERSKQYSLNRKISKYLKIYKTLLSGVQNRSVTREQ